MKVMVIVKVNVDFEVGCMFSEQELFEMGVFNE